MTKDILRTIVTRIALMMVSVLTGVITAHALGVSGRGEYFLVFTLANLAVQFGNLGLPTVNIYLLSKDPSTFAQLASNSLWASVVAAGGTGLLIVVIQSMHGISNLQSAGGIWFVPLMAPPIMGVLCLSNILIGMRRFVLYNALQVLSAAIQLTILVLLWAGSMGVFSFLAGTWISYTLSCLIIFLFIHQGRGFKLGFSISMMSGGLRFSLKAYLANFLAYAFQRGGALLLGYCVGSSVLGIYSISLNIADAMCVIPASVATIMFPLLLKEIATTSYRKVLLAGLQTGAVTAAAGIMCGALGGLAIGPVFGRDFSASAGVFWYMVPGLAAYGFVSINSQYLAAMNYPIGNFLSWIVGGTVLLTLVLLKSELRSAEGVAIAGSIAYFVVAAGMLLTGVRVSRARGPVTAVV